MRQQTRKPIEEMQVDQVKLELNSRDDIPQILGGLQYIFLNPTLREQILKILDGLFPNEIDLHNGRPGMDRWSIFVMGVLRLNLNCDYFYFVRFKSMILLKIIAKGPANFAIDGSSFLRRGVQNWAFRT